MENKTQQENRLIMKIRAIRDAEAGKPYEQMDADLVAECADFLVDAENNRRPSQQELKEHYTQLPCFSRNVRYVRRALLIAACIAALFIAVTVMRVASSPGNVYSGITGEDISRIMELEPGETYVDSEGNVYEGAEPPEIFGTFQDARKLRREYSLDPFLVPEGFPGDNQVDYISYENIPSLGREINFHFWHISCQFDILLDCTIEEKIAKMGWQDSAAVLTPENCVVINGIPCYYLYHSKNTGSASDTSCCIFEYGGFVYVVQGENDEEAEKLIQQARMCE